jgi:DNA-binding GntR family transcriptional regulator
MSQSDIQIRAIARQYECLSKGGSPKANVVAEAILRCVENGYWQPNDKMPAELSLAEALPVSLGTIQAAYRTLTAKGVVARRRKDGTRLTSRVDVDSMNWHLRFSDIETGASLSCRSTVFSITRISETGAWNRFLPEVEEFACIARRWSIGDRFMVLSRLYISCEYYEQLKDLGMNTLNDINLRAVFSDTFRMPTLRATHSVSFREPTEEEASVLAVTPDKPLMVLEASGYTYRDQPFSYQVFSIPTDFRNVRLLV